MGVGLYIQPSRMPPPKEALKDTSLFWLGSVQVHQRKLEPLWPRIPKVYQQARGPRGDPVSRSPTHLACKAGRGTATSQWHPGVAAWEELTVLSARMAKVANKRHPEATQHEY